VAQRFGVAVSSAVKRSQRYRATGSVAPAKMGGHRKRRLDPHRVFIMERIRQTPHLTLHFERSIVVAVEERPMREADAGRIVNTT
jgi:transposase